MPAPKDPVARELWRQRITEAVRARVADPVAGAAHRERFNKVARSPEARAKTGKAIKALWDNPETRQARYDAVFTPESNAKRCVSQKNKWKNPEFCIAHRQASIDGMTPEAVAKHRENYSKWSRSAEGIATRVRQNGNPQARKRLSDMMRAKWRDPEYRSKQLQAFKDSGAYTRIQGLRQDPSFEEKRLSALINQLKPSSIERAIHRELDALGVEYVSQKRLGPYSADIYIANLKLIIECDGSYWHSKPGAAEYDARRDDWMARRGYLVARIKEAAIKADPFKSLMDALSRVGVDINVDKWERSGRN